MLLFAPLVLFVSGMNYIVDPARYFHVGMYEWKMADILLHGKNVATPSFFNDRRLQKYIIEGFHEKKDVLVLGSSRTMLISARMLGTTRFFNHSVNGALLEDFIALYEVLREKKFIPRTVILGLDPWLLNKNTGLENWKSLQTYYEKGAARLGLKGKWDEYLGLDRFVPYTYFMLISPVYFKISLFSRISRFRLRNHTAEKMFYATAQPEGNDPILHPDGTRSYRKALREKSVEDVRKLAYDYVNVKPVYALESFTELDNAAQKKLETFVGSLKKDGVNVIFFFVPYHPVTYRLLAASQNYKIILDAQKNGIIRIGSYNPAELSCGEEDFYDGMHPKSGAIEHILKPFLKSINRAKK